MRITPVGSHNTKGLDTDLCSICIAPRWFAGYFTSAGLSWFFESAGDDSCGAKAYTLTSNAKTPRTLPKADDPVLKEVVRQAIGLVASIHYKRCPPADSSGGLHVRLRERLKLARSQSGIPLGPVTADLFGSMPWQAAVFSYAERDLFTISMPTLRRNSSGDSPPMSTKT